MKFGQDVQAASGGFMSFAKFSGAAVIGVLASAQTALAQAAGAAATAAPVATASAAAAGAYQRMAPTPGKGMPVPGGLGLQDQYSPMGDYGLWIHEKVLMGVMTVISLLVLGLLLYVILRYNRRANPVPSKTTHNTL